MISQGKTGADVPIEFIVNALFTCHTGRKHMHRNIVACCSICMHCTDQEIRSLFIGKYSYFRGEGDVHGSSGDRYAENKRTYVRIISLNPSKIKGLNDATFRLKPPVIAF